MAGAGGGGATVRRPALCLCPAPLTQSAPLPAQPFSALWRHLESIGWRKVAQKGIRECQRVYCVPGGGGGGPEGIDWCAPAPAGSSAWRPLPTLV